MHVVVFAAGLDWLEGLLPFLFVLFWIVSQVVNVVRNVAGRGQPRPQPGPPVRPPRPDRERVEEVRADLERQIEEFITQKAERRGGPAPGPVRIPPRPQPERATAETLRIEKPRTGKTAPAASPARGVPVESVGRNTGKKSPPPSQLGSLGSHGGDIARHVRDAFADDLDAAFQRGRRRPICQEGLERVGGTQCPGLFGRIANLSERDSRVTAAHESS
jgi:hypothetical protein